MTQLIRFVLFFTLNGTSYMLFNILDNLKQNRTVHYGIKNVLQYSIDTVSVNNTNLNTLMHKPTIHEVPIIPRGQKENEGKEK